MRVTRIWDQSGEARRKRHWALRRKRGTTLTEMVLYLGIAAAVMTFSFGLLREEQVRRERTALAAELAQITTAAQTCVAANYANIRDQLVNDPSGRRTDQGL
jgi:Tfp pilus assembly protein FimT